MPFELDELHLDEISFVPAGANPGARAVLMKNRRKGFHEKERGGIMADMDSKDERVGLWKRIGEYFGISEDDLALTKEVANVDTNVQKQLDDLTTEVGELKKAKATAESITTAVGSIAKAKSVDEVNAVVAALKDADVLKAVTDPAAERRIELDAQAGNAEVNAFREKLPESLQKTFDGMDADGRASFMKSYSVGDSDPIVKALATVTATNESLIARLEKMEDAEDLRKATADLDGLESVVDDIPAMAKTITSLRKTAPAAADDLLEKLRATSKRAADAGLFVIKGSDKGGVKNADERLDKAVAKYREIHPDVTAEVAMTKVLEEQPGLYNEHLDEKDGD